MGARLRDAMRPWWLIGGGLWMLGIGSAQAANREYCKRSQYGEEIAQRVCSTCHVVAKDQKFPPLIEEPTPSFYDIAARPSTTAQSLRRFITTTHWDGKTYPLKMPDLELNAEQIGAVACYILNLRQHKP